MGYLWSFVRSSPALPKIHDKVYPLLTEKVITKYWPNSFHQTVLLDYLQKEEISRLIITGMMTFMCVDATTRAAKDMGFECILIHDTTASPPTEFNGVSCSAEQVKAAFTSALSWICDGVMSTSEYLRRL